MSSFYGNGVVVSGGGSVSGGTNYNELDNKPIINLTGILPINLSLLKPGVYKIKGNYKYNEEEDTQTWLTSNIVYVYIDELTKHKILYFDVYENDKRYANTVVYYDNGTFSQEKLAYGSTIIAAEQAGLPETGEANKLYTTEDGIYIYSKENECYQKLGDSYWESL